MPNFNFPEVFYNQNFKQKCCWPVVWKLVREPCALTISIVPREGWLKTFGLLCEWESSRGKASLAPECYVGFRAWRQRELSEQARAGALLLLPGVGTEPRQLSFAVNPSQTKNHKSRIVLRAICYDLYYHLRWILQYCNVVLQEKWSLNWSCWYVCAVLDILRAAAWPLTALSVLQL